jgi:hypothetical protein
LPICCWPKKAATASTGALPRDWRAILALADELKCNRLIRDEARTWLKVTDHAGMRSFMVFPPGSIGFYLDWRSQEVGVAAALSGDHTLIDDYASGDVYHALARLCGLTDFPDPFHWKKLNRPMRDRMKPLQLGINYGMGVPSLARGLDRHPLIASEIIERHKRRYRRFWQWRSDMVQDALLHRRMESVFGWPLHITHSVNQRTLYNFPMQSGGAEMLRLAAVRLCDAGIVPIMLIHDGILFEETDREKLDHAIEIMCCAGRDVCDGLEIGVDIDQLRENGSRYQDKRPMAQNMVVDHHDHVADNRRPAAKGRRMINPRWVMAHGKMIEIETLETPTMVARKSRKAKQGEEFAIVPLKWAAAIAKDTNTQRGLVWIVLLYMSWKAKSKTFPVSNVALAPIRSQL